jgi:F0F1-type ATP synthase membrane subunit b/b'
VDLDLKRDRTIRAQLRAGALRSQLEAVTQELEELREENARLRIDATRPRSLRSVGSDLQTMAGAVLGSSGGGEVNGDAEIEDDLDDAWHRLAEARLLRATVASALAELQVVCEQLLSRLELEVGTMEIDRRASERDRAAIRSLGNNECR